MHTRTNNSAFTLIELLIVIAIIAILAVVVVLTLNPAEMMREARDSNRLSDLSTLDSALGTYQAQGGNFLGAPDTVYVSIPDPSLTGSATSTCASLGLPILPSGYAYQCASPEDYRDANGTGWVPINFSSLDVSNILSELPVDPTNQSSTRLYYTYTTNGTQYEVTAPMESQKYQLGGSNDAISGDGSPLATVYAKGTNLTLEPLDYGDPGLVGYWPLNEGIGTIAYDMSGNNATGSWNGAQAGTSGHYSAGHNQAWAGSFDGSTTYVALSHAVYSNPITVTAWFKTGDLYATHSGDIIDTDNNYRFLFVQGTSPPEQFNFSNNDDIGWVSAASTITLNDNRWHFVVGIRTNDALYLYVDGSFNSTVTAGNPGQGSRTNIGADWNPSVYQQYFTGQIQDVRIYNRALSPAEVQALYNAEK